ncbi:MAG: SoxR reducing system RseC family protein [Halothiobacillaceae bacterium]
MNEPAAQVEEAARVIESGDGFAWVETQRKHACGGCQARNGCGVGLLHQALGIKARPVRVIDPLGVRPGEEVVIALRDTALVSGAARVYLLPLIGMLVGAVTGHALQGELGAILLGIAGLMGGFALVSRLGNRVADNPDYQPVIVRRHSQAVSLDCLETGTSRPD